ncbi:Myosin-like protein, partial [Phytophthora palmivora]
MWTVLFGENEGEEAAQPRGAVKTPAAAPSPQHSTPPVTPSPLEDPRPSTPPPQPNKPQPPAQSRHVGVTMDAKGKSGESEDTPMSMLLKRLNLLMLKVGEHEFEKKTLVDQMEKERKLLTVQIKELEKQIEDLKDQNVQLQYKIEYTSEPMLMERVQDITDMRDALAAVKKQLEAELQDKEKELRESKTSLAAKDKELSALREEYEKQIDDLTAEREAAKEEAANAVRVASDAASEKYEEQLKEKDEALQLVTDLKETLEVSLAEKEQVLIEKDQALNEAEAATAEVQRSLAEVQVQGEADAKAIEQLQQELEQVAREHEQKLQQLKDEEQRKLDALEKHAQEQESISAEKTQELEDYKHDCVELWKINEDLKQQIALTSAETMLKQAELR